MWRNADNARKVREHLAIRMITLKHLDRHGVTASKNRLKTFSRNPIEMSTHSLRGLIIATLWEVLEIERHSWRTTLPINKKGWNTRAATRLCCSLGTFARSEHTARANRPRNPTAHHRLQSWRFSCGPWPSGPLQSLDMVRIDTVCFQTQKKLVRRYN